MKPLLLSVIPLLCCAGLAQAGQTLSYPKKEPLVAFDVPDDWKPQEKNGSLFVVSPDGGDVIIELMTMEAGVDDDAAALKEAKGTVDQDFTKLKLTPADPVKAKGMEVILLGGEGTDDSGPAHINMTLIKHPDAKHRILFSIIASKEHASKHGEAVGKIMESLSPFGAGKPDAPAAGGGAVQTFSYPDKDKPDYAMDFPAEWKMKETEEGVYVESPDKLVAMNVIMVDKAEVKDAVDSLKKSVGGRFKEIEWNGGKDPEVNKDEALGLTATFHNASASDGEGTTKYSINLVTYVRKKDGKSLIFLCQNPLKALDKHGDAMEAVLKSIKVR